METVAGTVEVRRLHVGSKSEGDYACVKCDDGRDFKIYRAGVFPAGDAFLRSFASRRVSLDGEAETGGYFLVSALRLEDGTPQPFPPLPKLPSVNFDFASLKTVPAKRESAPLRFPKKSKKRGVRR